MTDPRPPRLARALLGALLPPGLRTETLGDLDERFGARVSRDGPVRARRWYRRQALRLALWGLGRWVDGPGRDEAGKTGDLWGPELWSDVRFGARSLVKHRGYTLVAVLTLSLGIGGNTAVFSVVDGVLLRPLPFEEPDRLVAIHETRAGQSWWSAAVPNALAWQERSRTLEDVAWSQLRRVSLLPASGEPEPLRAAEVSPNFLGLLGVQPVLGQAFRVGDDRPGAEPVVVLTHATWTGRFSGDPEVLGRRVDLDGVPHTVVGVLPEGREPAFLGPHDLLVPRGLSEADRLDRGRVLQAIGRLSGGTDLEGARLEMAALGAEIDAEAPGGDARGWGVRLVPLKEQMVGSVRAPLAILLGAVGFVLLVACANLGSLMLARGSARQAELALRAALGAGRARLVRHLLVESALVALLGGALGLLWAAWGTGLLLGIDPSALPRLTEVSPDVRVVAFTGLVTALAAAVFGVAPALSATRAGTGTAVFSGRARGGTGRAELRTRSGLVVAEVALVAALLVGAGVMVRSLQALVDVDPGFEVGERVAVRLNLPVTRYPDPASAARFSSGLTERVRALPGVRAAGTVTTLPLSGGPGFTSFQIARSLPAPEPGSEPLGGMEIVSPGYFEAMGIPLLGGRDFTAADGADALPVTIVDRATVQRLWPEGDPLTDAVSLGPPGAGPWAAWREVVGVVGAVRYGLDADPRPRLYLPEGQQTFSPGARTLVVRTEARADEALLTAVRAAVHEIDPLLSIERIDRLEDVARTSLARPRFQTTLWVVFAAVALGLGLLGVYGVVSYSVARRTRETGVRLALGAGRATVVGRVLRDALGPVLAGLALGVAGAAGLSGVLARVAFGVEPLDPVSFVAAPVLLLLAAVVAALVPGVRAARVDPVEALRHE